MAAWSTGSVPMPEWSHRFVLNFLAMGGLLAGALITFLPGVESPPELQGALWGALIAWLVATKANGSP